MLLLLSRSVVSNSVRPHRWQPTRLRPPQDFPGKNTAVGCHFFLQCVKVKLLSHVRLFATPWTVAHQAPPSMGFSRQEYWSGLPFYLYGGKKKSKLNTTKQAIKDLIPSCFYILSSYYFPKNYTTHSLYRTTCSFLNTL